MAFSNKGSVVVKATVYGSDGSCVRIVRSHADVTSMTDCSDLLLLTNEHAHGIDSTAKLSSFSLCKAGADGQDFVTLGLGDEDFVTEAVLVCETGESLSFSETSGVTFSAKYVSDATGGSSQPEVHHHVHPDEEHLLDLSVVEFADGPLTRQELKQCHQWGVFNAKQLRQATAKGTYQLLPKRLRTNLPERFVAVANRSVSTQDQLLVNHNPVPEALFDVSIGTHGFMHAAAPFKALSKGGAAIDFHLDAKTVHVRQHHQDAIGHHLIDMHQESGSIGTAVSITHDGDITVALRHSDESTLGLLDQGVCPTKLELHQCSHQMAVLDATHLRESINTRCRNGHVYKHTITPVDDDWTLNEVSVRLHDSPASRIKLALLQSDSRTLVLSCGFRFSQDKTDAFVDRVIKTFGANIQGSRPEGQGSFEAYFDTVTVSLVWNGQTYTFELEHEWFVESGKYPLDRTRFGDLYIQALNVARGRPGVAADLPKVAGTNRPQLIDLEVSWQNSRNAQVVFSTGLRYEKLWYEEQGDESGWTPYVVGTIGQIESGGRQNFNPMSGDSALKLVFDIGGPTSINQDVSGSSQRRITEAGNYRLLPAGAGPHPHTVSVDANGNGVSSMQYGHVHPVINGEVQAVYGHTHDWERLDA
jgi:hypothetical protein